MKDDIKNRFAFIETRLLWCGGVTAQQLADAFGLARQNAQGIIGEYRRRHPENIVRDLSRKRQVAGENFMPHYIRPGAGDFLDYLRSQTMAAYYLEVPNWDELLIHNVDHLLRGRLSNGIVREILASLHNQQVITLYYYAKSGARMRDFSPNHLIFAENRYHIRGYCHMTEQYLDFVLSRITHVESSEREWVSSDSDTDWNTYERLRFKPNAVLPKEAIMALRLNFATDEEGEFKLHCRRALAFYVKRELLAIDPNYGVSRWKMESPVP